MLMVVRAIIMPASATSGRTVRDLGVLGGSYVFGQKGGEARCIGGEGSGLDSSASSTVRRTLCCLLLFVRYSRARIDIPTPPSINYEAHIWLPTRPHSSTWSLSSAPCSNFDGSPFLYVFPSPPRTLPFPFSASLTSSPVQFASFIFALLYVSCILPWVFVSSSFCPGQLLHFVAFDTVITIASF
jgi:hypothetical protein